MSAINVLYVDDEQQNLNSFMAAFRRKCRVFLATSVLAAFEILQKEEIHVLISDQRMPEITGVEFLKQAKEKYPDIPRILLTGYTDIEVLADAVNQGDIYRYITKPWNELELLNGILNAYDQYRAGKALKEKVEELQKTNDGLNRFVYSISHELRAPIASAKGIMDLVKMEGFYEESDGYWKLMNACIQKLDYYVTQTVQFYKTLRFNVSYEQIRFKEMVNTLISLYRTSANAKDIHFNIAINEQQPFWGDAFRLEIIIANLLSNAIKCQRADEPDKWVEVSITTTPQEALITVADNGIGIAGEDLGRIFDQFFKGANLDGLGLGLYILKESLDKLNGTIDVQSGLGKGSVFKVTVPNKESAMNT
ncbi:hybrid sensor histidine kinase/response regulator [Niabella ginsenosidivorans]|uniref:histidine kinase n=1 Tax=Niabella ginsenosidivorans TaxID=1176587 RepID=A0A1A9HXQ4_9BACT|nr:hybrid sensor histidine kinase/response regulator [Niabella ginsenosidivorans]ANH80166.1 hybrid sensor histidine kinase/response regulator [Niabella ginsenosidivorans]